MTEKKTRKRRGQREDGRIQVTYTDGIRPDGKPNRISFYGKTRKEAEEKRVKYIKDKENGLDALASTITVNEWLDKYLEMYAVRTIRIQHNLNHIREDIGTLKMQDVREAHLFATMLKRYGGKSKGAALQYKGTIRNIFKKAKKNRIITDDPAEDLSIPDNVSSGTHRALEAWEIDIIMKHWHEDKSGLWVLIMLTTGIRRGELMALDWKNIDLKNRIIKITDTVAKDENGKEAIRKGTKSEAGQRNVPICAVLYDALSAIPKEWRNGLVIRAKRGGIVSHFLMSKNIDEFCETMSQYSDTPIMFLPHDLRHTYATMLYDSGVDIKSAQYYLGHANINMTLSLYTHLSENKKILSAETIIKHIDELTAKMA